MNKIKLYQIKNVNKCPYRAYISQFNLKTQQNKSSAIRKVYTEIIQNNEYNFIELTSKQLKSIISELLEDTYFLTKQEKEVEEIIILKHMLRYIEFEKKLIINSNRKILSKKIEGTVIIGENEIEVKADMVFENENNIEIVKYRTSVTSLSVKARMDKNKPEFDMELFLLKKLGEQLYSEQDKPIISSFYHLKGKKDEKDLYKQFLEDSTVLATQLKDLDISFAIHDKKAQKAIDKGIKDISDVLYFNNSTGNNIITFDYDDDLSDKIIELSNTELSFNSEKCVSTDCDFCNFSTLCNHKVSVKNELQEVIEVSKSSGDVRLTDAQKSVVDVEFGNYRINSVAGSGKTTVMAMRTIELLKKEYKIQDLLLITYTKKGAEEIREKIGYWVNHYNMKNIDVSKLNIFTFNGFGESVIDKEWETLGFTQKPELASTVDINDTIKDLLEEYDKIEWLNYKNPLIDFPHIKGAFIQLKNYFNTIKSFNYDKDTLCEEILRKEKYNLTIDKNNTKSKLIFEMYCKFNQLLKEKNLLQYQDQLLYLIDLFEQHEELIDVYGNFKHVVCDEFQDSNPTQIKLLHILKKYKINKSLMVVGDNSQCLLPETIIHTKEGNKKIEDITLQDEIMVCNGITRTTYANIEEVKKTWHCDKIVKITTKLGKEIIATPNHILFSRIEIPEDKTNRFFTYLMYRKEQGYRIGRTSSVRQVDGKEKNGFEGRLNQEQADKLWILACCDTIEESMYLEQYYSYKYSIPQYRFITDNAQTQFVIDRLFRDLNTREGAKRLFKDKLLFEEYPHHKPRAKTTNNRTRRNLNFVEFGCKTFSKELNICFHELGMNSMDKEYGDIVHRIMGGISMKKTKVGTIYYNGRKLSRDYDECWNMMQQVKKELNGDVVLGMKARLTDKKYDFTPASHMLKGFSIPVMIDNKIVDDIVEKVEYIDYEGYVYDINVPRYRNYIANDIAVHNCIFGFNNTNQENIINFHKEFKNVKDIYLLDNFRSTPQICSVANKLDKLNTQRIDKEIISRKADGKLPQLLKFQTLENENKSITDIIETKINQGIAKHEICYIARTKKELLEMQKCLNDRGIDNVVEASELYLDNTYVQSIINLSNFFRDMEQDYYLMEYMNIENGGFKKIDIEDIKIYIAGLKDSIIYRFSKFEDKEDKEQLKIEYFNEMVERITDLDEVSKSFMENINSKTFETFNGLLNYLHKIELYKDDMSITKNNDVKFDCVVLTTAHSSKGKEWEIVINSINKYKYDGQELEDLEEERRLLFVSLTRSKDELFITYQCNMDKARSKGKFCRFAEELEDVERIDIE